MKASRTACRIGVVALFLSAAAWCVYTVAAVAGSSLPPATTPGEPAVAVSATAAPVAALPAGVMARSAVVLPIVGASSVASVRVYGRVTRSGSAVGGTELSFYPARDAWRERAFDWAITDADGSYEVALPPDSYLVDLQDTGLHASTVIVRSGPGEQVVDLVLPDALPGSHRASRAAAGRR